MTVSKSKDKQISFLINLIHFTFCCNVSIKLMLGEGSSLISMVNLFVYSILALCFMYITFTVMHDKKYLFLYTFFVILYVFSYILGNADITLLLNKGILTMITCVPVLAGVIYIKNKRILYEEYLRFSYITILIMIPVVVFHQGSEYSYSMSFSYYLLLPCLFQLNRVFKKKQMKSVMFCVISALAIIAYGARGPILCLAAGVILEVLYMEVKFSQKLLYMTCFILSCWLVIANLYAIIDFLQNLLGEFGIYSRSLDVLKNPSFDITSGRTDIFEYYIPIIYEHPLLGSGVYGNWISSDLGPHNAIIECYLAFGIVFSTFYLMILLLIPYLLFKLKNVYTKRLLVIFLSYNFTMFFVSGNIMTSYNWFLLFGLIISELKFKGGIKHVYM